MAAVSQNRFNIRELDAFKIPGVDMYCNSFPALISPLSAEEQAALCALRSYRMDVTTSIEQSARTHGIPIRKFRQFIKTATRAYEGFNNGEDISKLADELGENSNVIFAIILTEKSVEMHKDFALFFKNVCISCKNCKRY
jgi:hypothetical protein